MSGKGACIEFRSTRPPYRVLSGSLWLLSLPYCSSLSVVLPLSWARRARYRNTCLALPDITITFLINPSPSNNCVTLLALIIYCVNNKGKYV